MRWLKATVLTGSALVLVACSKSPPTAIQQAPGVQVVSAPQVQAVPPVPGPTTGSSSKHLSIRGAVPQPDGSYIEVNGKVVGETYTLMPGQYLSADFVIQKSGAGDSIGVEIERGAGRYRIVWQGDGNLAVYTEATGRPSRFVVGGDSVDSDASRHLLSLRIIPRKDGNHLYVFVDSDRRAFVIDKNITLLGGPLSLRLITSAPLDAVLPMSVSVSS